MLQAWRIYVIMSISKYAALYKIAAANPGKNWWQNIDYKKLGNKAWDYGKYMLPGAAIGSLGNYAATGNWWGPGMALGAAGGLGYKAWQDSKPATPTQQLNQRKQYYKNNPNAADTAAAYTNQAASQLKLRAPVSEQTIQNETKALVDAGYDPQLAEGYVRRQFNNPAYTRNYYAVVPDTTGMSNSGKALTWGTQLAGTLLGSQREPWERNQPKDTVDKVLDTADNSINYMLGGSFLGSWIPGAKKVARPMLKKVDPAFTALLTAKKLKELADVAVDPGDYARKATADFRAAISRGDIDTVDQILRNKAARATTSGAKNILAGLLARSGNSTWASMLADTYGPKNILATTALATDKDTMRNYWDNVMAPTYLGTQPTDPTFWADEPSSKPTVNKDNSLTQEGLRTAMELWPRLSDSMKANYLKQYPQVFNGMLVE